MDKVYVNIDDKKFELSINEAIKVYSDIGTQLYAIRAKSEFFGELTSTEAVRLRAINSKLELFKLDLKKTDEYDIPPELMK